MFVVALVLGRTYDEVLEIWKGNAVSITGNATLVIDFGNSETRTATIFGKTPKGRLRMETGQFSNRYADIDNYSVPEQYITEGDTVIFEYSGVTWASGQMVEREFYNRAIRPSGARAKADALTTQLAFIRAVYEGYCAIAEMYGCHVDEIDVTWDIHTLLPPVEMKRGKDNLIKKLEGITSLDFVHPAFHTDLKIRNIEVYPEGFSAFIGALIEPHGPSLIKGNESLASSSVLVVDIGAGTTDFCVVQDQKLVDSTRHTAKVGGNNVVSKVKNFLLEDGIEVPEANIQKATQTGILHKGSRQMDVSDSVNEARKEVAQQLNREILTFIEASTFSLQSIEYILVCGGGALSAENRPELVPLGTYLEEEIKTYAPNTEQVKVPSNISLRGLNLAGATVLSVIS